MPMYVYKAADGEMTQRFYHAHQKRRPNRIRVNGKAFIRDIAAEHAGFRNTPANWPMECFALGCLPKQRKQFMADAAKRGVPTEFNEEVDAVFRDKDHYNRYKKAYGVFDKNAGYGDISPHHVGK